MPLIQQIHRLKQ